jgi:hypothetical protein
MDSGQLSSADRQRFERDGYVILRQAFARADASAMASRWWTELRAAHGIGREDPSSWRPIIGDLKAAKRDPLQVRILTPRVRGVIDELLGEGAWSAPKDWGRCLVTFPQAGAWDVPTGLWHWDSPCALHVERLNALFVVIFVDAVAARGGGTLILSGSPQLLMRLQRQLSRARPHDPTVSWDDFHRSHPWLMALTGKARSPADRVAAFIDSETVEDGAPLRVVELTGEAGDMVICHPAMVHCASQNRGAVPRFMRIKQQLLTREGRRLSNARRSGGA